jgi:Amt family ammonium transporter
VGALLTGWFIRDGSGDFAQVIVQGKSIVVTVLWSAVASIIGLYAAKLICGDIRVEEDVEHGGLDRAEHGEEAYNWEA